MDTLGVLHTDQTSNNKVCVLVHICNKGDVDAMNSV